MAERVLSAEDVRVLASYASGVIVAYLSRGPSSTVATLNERQAVERLRYALDALEREKVSA